MITIYPFKDKRISLELNFIAFVASYYLSRVKSVKSIKVFFIDRTKNSYINKDGKNSYTVDISFDLEEYCSLNSGQEKIKKQVYILSEIIRLFKEENILFDENLVNHVIEELKGSNQIKIPIKLKVTGGGKYKAQMYVVCSIDNFSYYMDFFEGNKILCSIFFFKGITSDFYVDTLFHEGRWLSLNQFVIYDSEYELQFNFELDKCEFKLTYNDQYRDRIEIQNKLRMWQEL
jgi:hypothetical protein